MDSLTQIVLGAAVGEATLGKKAGNKAMLWGAIAGTIPDLDVIGRFFLDDITALEWHRGISHSLFFSIVASLVLGMLLFRFHKNRKNEANQKQWTWLFFMALVTHPLLDCHTTWGTQFFWPFDLRIAYNNINVVDPIYTLPFLTFVLMALFKRRGSDKRIKYNNTGLIVSSFYMLITIGLKGASYQTFKHSLQEQNIEYSSILNRPTMFNAVLWTANVETKDSFLIGYYSFFDKDKHIPFIGHAKHQSRIDSIRDEPQIARLLKITKGWYVIRKKQDTLRLCDLRFGEFEEGSDEFVFTHNLVQKRGEWVVEQVDPKFSFSDIPAFMTVLCDRIIGNEDALKKPLTE
ncbi:MAG: inner membrane protein [bacterium]|jgi:inner membrane protein